MPRALVFGSFALVAVPLAAYLLVATHGTAVGGVKLPIAQAYIVLLGMTHFFLTFTIYLSSANRQHFLSSRRNIVAFVAAPLVPLVGVAAFYGLGLEQRFVALGIVLFLVIRTLDFYHLSRQSFGVLQLFKGKNVRAIPAWTRTAENFYFLSLAALMLMTFVNDLRFDARSPLTWAVALLSAGLLATVLVGYAMGVRAGADRKQTATALAYLAVQTGCSMLAIYRTGLYIAALAVHNVEYHVIMAPRVFHAPIGEGDRALAAARRMPLALYAVLLVFAGVWYVMQQAQGHVGGTSSRMLVHMFDGIFVFHYIIEMSIWKFSDPYFRKSLGPLYMP